MVGGASLGTPAPFAPPQRLVVVGLYRHVRNPMYLGFAVGWIGLWVIFGHANPVAIAGVAAVAPSPYICSFSFMKSPLCAASSGQTTNSIAGTRIDGGRVCEAGTSRNSGRIGQMCSIENLASRTPEQSRRIATRRRQHLWVPGRVVNPPLTGLGKSRSSSINYGQDEQADPIRLGVFTSVDGRRSVATTACRQAIGILVANTPEGTRYCDRTRCTRS
jgi:hypothetical protein